MSELFALVVCVPWAISSLMMLGVPIAADAGRLSQRNMSVSGVAETTLPVAGREPKMAE